MVPNQISEKDETEKDAIQSNSVALSDEDCQKNVETSTGNASQNPEEDVIKEVQIPSSTTPLVAEEDLVGEKGRDDMLEEVKKEQTLQIEVSKIPILHISLRGNWYIGTVPGLQIVLNQVIWFG